MKNRLLLMRTAYIITFLMIASACGDDDEVQNPPQDAGNEGQETDSGNETNNNATNTGNENETNTGTDNEATTDENRNTPAVQNYGFTEFNLEADYDGVDDAINIEFEVEGDRMEATYIDPAQDIALTGDGAMEELDTIFTSFKFDENTPNDEVLNAVIKAFNIVQDVQNIELDITFDSGTEKEYRQ